MKAVIIGGGIIGLSSAFFLKSSGWDVIVVDQGDMTHNCSYVNLGMVVPSHFVPLAAPGMVSQGIRWMFDRKSPFYVRPTLSGRLISWGLKFMRSANDSHVSNAAEPLRDLSLLSCSIFDTWAAMPELDFGYERKGIIMYFNSSKTGDEEVHLAEKAVKLGLDAIVLGPQELSRLEPAVQPNVMGGVHYRCDGHLNPDRLMRQLMGLLADKGVLIERNREVIGFTQNHGRITSVKTKEGAMDTDLVVLANGSWLPDLAKMVGMNIPLMPGKGYSFMQANPPAQLNIPAILCEARVAITPMGGGIRFGGTMEIDRIREGGVNMNRVAGIVESLPRYFDNFRVEMPDMHQVSYGYRPCSPDGMPYIGSSRRHDNLLVAGGHAMMGLSLGPVTGKLIAGLANGEKPEIDLKPFDPNRFD